MQWHGRYNYAEHKCSPNDVKKFFSFFKNKSRLITIALYYYNNTASLTTAGYIEDAGMNLHLSMEVIIKDFMSTHSIKNKRRAIESFISKVWSSDWGTDYLDGLWKSRNQFLAHIDENMFTVDQKINDPDMYCFDTFEIITCLITRYTSIKIN